MKDVLIIDDDLVERFIAHNFITRSGLKWNIHEAASGQQAFDFLQSRYAQQGSLPDVILLDLLMPVMDGLQFLEAFQKLPYTRTSDTKIIVLTISGNRERQRRSIELGAIAVLEKPLNP